jgi:hypothetical protein
MKYISILNGDSPKKTVEEEVAELMIPWFERVPDKRLLKVGRKVGAATNAAVLRLFKMVGRVSLAWKALVGRDKTRVVGDTKVLFRLLLVFFGFHPGDCPEMAHVVYKRAKRALAARGKLSNRKKEQFDFLFLEIMKLHVGKCFISASAPGSEVRTSARSAEGC